jgi:hypothetical protein
MEAGPRDIPPRRDTTAEPELPPELLGSTAIPESRGPLEPFESLESMGVLDPMSSLEPLGSLESMNSLESLETIPSMEDAQSFGELRPQRRLRIWQLAPIVILAAVGSLMFAFPLAFEFGDGGPVVAMLGLLISCCAAGWGLMAARRVGYTLPGLPAKGSGERPDWRVAGLYTVTACALVALAVWRVARLR